MTSRRNSTCELQRYSDVAGSSLLGGGVVLDDKFSQEGQKDNIVGKTTSSRKLWGAQLTREVDLGGGAPLAYPQLRGCSNTDTMVQNSTDYHKEINFGVS